MIYEIVEIQNPRSWQVEINNFCTRKQKIICLKLTTSDVWWDSLSISQFKYHWKDQSYIKFDHAWSGPTLMHNYDEVELCSK